jgi:hypothetical protein
MISSSGKELMIFLGIQDPLLPRFGGQIHVCLTNFNLKNHTMFFCPKNSQYLLILDAFFFAHGLFLSRGHGRVHMDAAA